MPNDRPEAAPTLPDAAPPLAAERHATDLRRYATEVAGGVAALPYPDELLDIADCLDALRAALAEHPIHNEHTIAYEGEGIAWDERIDDDDWLSGKAVNERIRRAHEGASIPKSAMAIVTDILHETTTKLNDANAALTRAEADRERLDWLDDEVRHRGGDAEFMFSEAEMYRGHSERAMSLKVGEWQYDPPNEPPPSGVGQTVRAAIDAAMRGADVSGTGFSFPATQGSA